VKMIEIAKKAKMEKKQNGELRGFGTWAETGRKVKEKDIRGGQEQRGWGRQRKGGAFQKNYVKAKAQRKEDFSGCGRETKERGRKAWAKKPDWQRPFTGVRSRGK